MTCRNQFTSSHPWLPSSSPWLDMSRQEPQAALAWIWSRKLEIWSDSFCVKWVSGPLPLGDIYNDIYIFKEYAVYILCIYMVYTWYIQWHLLIPGISITYTMYMHGIYMDIHGISCAYAPPGGWFCRGGQGPIPPAPPAMTLPGWIITLSFSIPANSWDSCSWRSGCAGRAWSK
jgi:hypothetical protein